LDDVSEARQKRSAFVGVLAVGFAAAIVAIAGFVGGYFGTFWLGRYGSAAPLNGIFISGPVGLFVGGAVGIVTFLRNSRFLVYALSVVVAAIAMLSAGVLLNLW
jgi:hypothetical protein